MKVPCNDCTVEVWGACHSEYGACKYAGYKAANIKTIYTKKELQDLNAFELWSLAEQLKVVNFEHLPQWDLIEAVLEKQESITVNQ